MKRKEQPENKIANLKTFTRLYNAQGRELTFYTLICLTVLFGSRKYTSIHYLCNHSISFRCKKYTLMQIHTDLDPPSRVHYLILIFAISGWLIENESRFLLNLQYKVKLN